MAIMGRPTIYSRELADEICNTIKGCTTSLVTLCKSRDSWPNHDTLSQWRHDHQYFSDQYYKAMTARAELFAQEAIDIADQVTQDYTYNEHGEQVVNHEAIARSKLRMEARKWFASKLASKTYGDKQQVEQTINVIPYGQQLKELE